MGMQLVQTPTGGLAVNHDNSGARNAAVQSIAWLVNRAPTNTAIVGILPHNALITRISILNPVVSNAATTANVSVGLNGGSATFFTAATDVKTAIGATQSTITANWAPSASAQTVTCTYTETGTASTAGTHYVSMEYVVL